MSGNGDYISREYVLKCMEDSYKNAGISAEAKAKMTRWLKKAPTADVRPVVLCRDCKHSEHWYADKSRCFLWHESGIDVFNDGFCNYGEKREEADGT